MNQAFMELYSPMEFYVNPVNRIHPPMYMERKSELNQYVVDEMTKMITGQRPVSDWDKMVQEYMAKGGQEVIDEVNADLQKLGIEGSWQP